jgi:hypothetical protein
MSSRAHNVTALERRVRRLAVRRGMSMLVARKPDPKVLAHGGYMLRDDDTGAIVFGEAGYAFSATLDEIEAFLTADPAE